MTKVLRFEAKGFKSFADKTELVFGDTFNVILGPNGSGKSNVLDALCFVLGKSGAKGLRAEKTANLIYNGGKSQQPAKQGEVSIFLDNSEKEFPLDAKEIKITRIIKQSGQSVYMINDEKYTREQILELLGSVSIDPNGYNIILQGDIVRLVEMSPLERRGIIEEIAGISVYEDKKQKALNEIQKIETNLNEAEIILSERSTYLKELKKERDQAVTFKELQERLKSLRATLINLDLVEREEKVDSIRQKSNEYKEKIDVVQSEINKLKENVATLKKEISDINHEVEEKGEKNQVELHRKVEQIKVDMATKNANLDNYNQEASRVREQKKSRIEELAEIKSKASLEVSELTELERSLKQNLSLQTDLKGKIDLFRKKNNLDNASEIDVKMDEMDKQSDALERGVFEVRNQQQELIREKDRLEIQINNADDRINKVLEVSKGNAKEIEELKEQKRQFKQATLDLQKSLTNDQAYVAQIKTARAKLNSVNEELAKIRVRQASLSERIGSNTAIKAILENRNKFDGVFGTVAELGVVDAKYGLALDTAAGSRLNSIVVKDDNVAAECIRYLRDSQAGVATFLPLNKIKGSDTVGPKDTRGVIGAAIDLIKFDPKFRAAFKHVFGGTIVVENIDVAKRIGIGTIKMVTLDGDLAETSGAMKGGFLKKQRGAGFQESQVAENMEKFERAVADSEMVVSRLETERQQNQELIDKLREHKAVLEGEIIKKEKSLHLESGDLEISKKLKQEFEEKLEEVSSKLEQVNLLVSAKNRELANVKIERQKLKSQIMDIRNPTKLAELNTFQQKLDELKSDAIRKESEIKTRREQSTIAEEVSKIENAISEVSKQEAEIVGKISALKSDIAAMKEDLAEKEKIEKEFYEKFRELFKRREQCEKKMSAEEEKIIKKEENIRELEQKNNAYSLELARYGAEISAFTEEMKAFEGVPILDEKNKDELKKEAWSADQKLARIGNVNMRALEVYDRVQTEFDKLTEKKDILVSEREKVLVMINEIDTKKQELFLRVFDVINTNFQKIFQILSTKGQAEMELENAQNPFEGGVIIKVRLKGKKFMDIRSLSGGEKTLTALAFIFSVQEHNPAPFYIFDEVDAALDKRNSEKLAGLIKSYSDRAQYIVISHNDGVISNADTLYGVSMNEHGKSKVVSLRI